MLAKKGKSREQYSSSKTFLRSWYQYQIFIWIVLLLKEQQITSDTKPNICFLSPHPFSFLTANANYSVVNGTRILCSSNESNVWVPIKGLIPFSNYTVQVKASNSQSSLMSDTITIVMPPGGKYEKSAVSVHCNSYANTLLNKTLFIITAEDWKLRRICLR